MMKLIICPETRRDLLSEGIDEERILSLGFLEVTESYFPNSENFFNRMEALQDSLLRKEGPFLLVSSAHLFSERGKMFVVKDHLNLLRINPLAGITPPPFFAPSGRLYPPVFAEKLFPDLPRGNLIVGNIMVGGMISKDEAAFLDYLEVDAMGCYNAFESMLLAYTRQDFVSVVYSRETRASQVLETLLDRLALVSLLPKREEKLQAER